MIGRITHINRHPIKSIGGEELSEIKLQAARRLPGDREWAVLHEAGDRHARASETNGEPDRWLPKSCFMVGANSSQLQAISGGWQDNRIALSHPDCAELVFDPVAEADRLIEWLRPLWPEDAPAPSRLVKGAAIWTDVKWPWLSILSLDSLAALESKVGKPLGQARWRGNIWVEGWPPFAEKELVGQITRINDVELRITEQIGRCQATCVDTEAGKFDLDMIATLSHHFGDANFGVYAEVVTGGEIASGDRIAV